MGWRLGQVGAGNMTDHLNKVWNTLYRLYLPDITKEAVTCSQWYSFFQIVPEAEGKSAENTLLSGTGAHHREGHCVGADRCMGIQGRCHTACVI